MNKRYITIIVIVISVIVIMNIAWVLALENERSTSEELENMNHEAVTLNDTISSELNKKIVENTELRQVLDAKESSINDYKNEISEFKMEVASKESQLHTVEKLVREYPLRVPSGEALSSKPLYKIEGSIHSMPYSDSKLLSNNETIGFLLGKFVNFMDEEWYYVEVFTTKISENRYGFISAESLGEELVSHKEEIFDEIDFNGIRIGDSIYSLLKDYNHNMLLEIEDDYWTITMEEIFVLINPKKWTVVGLLTKDEDVKILSDIHVGGSAVNAVKILSTRYPYYNSKENEIMYNWFELDKDGLTISFDYLGSEIEESTMITEIKLIRLKYVD